MGADRFTVESCSSFRRFIVKFNKSFYESYAKVKGPKETWGKNCAAWTLVDLLSNIFDFSLCPNIKLNESNKHDRLKHHPPKFQQHRNRSICLMYVRHLITSLVNGLICICVMMLEVRTVWGSIGSYSSSIRFAIWITTCFLLFPDGRSCHPDLNDGGALQISVQGFQVDYYPFHLANTGRSHWPK